MRTLWVGALALLASTGCVVRHYHGHPAPPPPPPPPPAHSTVTVQVGWSHVRYSIWAEYYGCSDDEIYYLENCGYDDDDLLVLCYIARRARVPIRWALWEYDRCGRSLYTVALVYRIDPYVFYCAEVPRFHRAPPVYARAYGYYWRGERPFLSNDECHALVHLQIGVRYYGYTPATYFEHHERGHQRNDRHVFRTIVVRDHPRCGSGGKNVHDTGIVRRERAWESRDIKDWEKKREAERAQVKIRHTPDHERQETEKAKRAAEAEDRRRAFEEARQRADVARKERAEADKRNPGPPEPKTVNQNVGGPKRDDDRPNPPGKPDDKGPDRVPPPRDGAARPKEDGGLPRGLDRKEDDDRRNGPPAKADEPGRKPEGPSKGPESDDDRRKGPPAKAAEPGRKPEAPSKGPESDDDRRKGPPAKTEEPRKPEAPSKADAPSRQPEKAPPQKAEEPRRAPEKAPPPPPKAEEPRRAPEKAPPPKRDSGDNRKPPPPPPQKSDDSRRGEEKAPPPPPKPEERRGPEKQSEQKKGSEKEKGSRGR